jgi:ferredoxin/flavodoxin---NADP+ reductase
VTVSSSAALIDFQAVGDIRDITVLGAGPVGLAAAFWAGMREASVQIVEALPEIGGQLTALYPEKWIYDVLGHRRILARDLVAELTAQSLGQFDVPVHLGTTAHGLSHHDDEVVLHTTGGELRTRTVILAGGHGAVEPRRLPDLDVTPWEGRGVHYVVGDKSAFAGRRVVVVGGGDSALDWVINLLDVASELTLVHRRERFRAHEATVSQVLAEVEAGRVGLRTSAVVAGVHGDGQVEAVELRDGEVIPCDELLLQLGFVTRLGPLEDWGFALDRQSIVVDGLMRTSLDRVWACGDVTTYPGKLKLIATGFGEAAMAVAQAVHHLRPEERLQPGYSTNTGVPGVVAGQA